MISLLRRNRKQTMKGAQLQQQRSLTRSQLSSQQQQRHEKDTSIELYNDSSLDSHVFAASLGLISTHQPLKDVMLVMQNASSPTPQQQLQKGQKQQQQQPPMEFHCRFCGKGYRWKSTMRRHETLECGDKPPSFQCPSCPYRARQRGNLTVHLKRHHQKV